MKYRNIFNFLMYCAIKKELYISFTMETIELPCWNPDLILLKFFNQGCEDKNIFSYLILLKRLKECLSASS